MRKKHNKLYENIYQKNNFFSFGKNWQNFLNTLDKTKIEKATSSLADFLGISTLKDNTFLDLGCGSGLFSYSAHLLNASKVISIDIDKSSIECCEKLREKKDRPSNWEIYCGSILDEKFVKQLPKTDIVYSWGVLHHTGDMYKAIKNAASLVKPEGFFYVAIYNEATAFPNSRLWLQIVSHLILHGLTKCWRSPRPRTVSMNWLGI